MSNTPTRNFSLTPELNDFIRAQVSSGRYSNASEVLRAGLRLLMERDAIKTRRRPNAASSQLAAGARSPS